MVAPNNSEGPVSLVISILPTAVQSRLPPLHSVRRTVGRLAVRTVTAGAISILGVGAPPSSQERPDRTRSEALYLHDDKMHQQQQHQHQQHADSVSRAAAAVSETKSAAALVGVEVVEHVDETGGGALRKRKTGASPSTRTVALPEGAVVGEDEDEDEEEGHCPKDDALRLGLSGVDWRYGCRGFQLLQQAKDEALISWRRRSRSTTTTSRDDFSDDQDEDDASLERKLFLDALSYTLKALPRDLDDDELRAIQASLPGPNALPISSLAHYPKASGGAGGTITTTGNGGGGGTSSRRRTRRKRAVHPRQEPRSILHRIVQILVSHFLVLVHVLFRYFVPLLRDLPRHVYGGGAGSGENGTRGLLGSGLELVSILGKQGANLTASAMDQMGEGTGRVLADGFAWATEGVVGGFTDGVADGLDMLACGGGAQAVAKGRSR